MFAVVTLGAFVAQVTPAAACPEHGAGEVSGLLGGLVEEIVSLVL